MVEPMDQLQCHVVSHLAVLMTSHNRCRTTLTCLRSLYAQEMPESFTVEIYLVDDGCIDGTSNAVRKQFPDVKVLRGDGNLYWCGGMRFAWIEAMREDYDAYLWLNDDTCLKTDALMCLLNCAQNHLGVIVGSCHDPLTGKWTYGGRATKGEAKSLSSIPVEPCNRMQSCQQINGNVVLVTRSVVEKIGILSDKFTHAMGDFDYGFRALDAGIPLIVAPNYQATCCSNTMPAWCNPNTPFSKRLKLFNTPKGIYFSEFMMFCYRHFGLKCIFIGVKVISRLLMPGLWMAANDDKP